MTRADEQSDRLYDSPKPDVISSVISDILIQTPGVARLTGRQSKGVRVVIKDDTIQVNIRFIADFGKPIPEIARRIQDETKSIISNDYPAYRIVSVNVWVEGIHFTHDSALYRTAAVASLGQ